MATLAMPQTRRFTKAEFFKMCELGWFIDQHVEFIDGEPVIMPAPGHEHCVSTEATADALRPIFGAGFWIRIQMALNLGLLMEPQPDVAVVQGHFRTFTARPTTALLVVEISDTTLAYDQGRKASLYAAAGIADYWIVNLSDRQLEIYRNPVADPTEPFGFRYADVTILGPNDVAIPLAAPQAQIPVAQLLP